MRACGAPKLTANASSRDVGGQKGFFGSLMHVQRMGAASQSLEWLSVRGAGSTPGASRARGEATLIATHASIAVPAWFYLVPERLSTRYAFLRH